MSDPKDECSGYIRGAHHCRHGFPQNGACWSPALGVPVCCKEEVCGRLYDHQGGKPAQPANVK